MLHDARRSDVGPDFTRVGAHIKDALPFKDRPPTSPHLHYSRMISNWDEYGRIGVDVAVSATALTFYAVKSGTRFGVSTLLSRLRS